MSNRKGVGIIVNRSELANYFGRAMPTVDHWVRSGCPVEQRGGRGKPWKFNTADVAAWREQKAREEASGTAQADEDELKRRKLAAETEKAELELAQAKGEVAPLDQIERAAAMVFAEIRANMRNIPGRIMPRLIGETNEIVLKRTLLDEIDRALDALSESDLVTAEDLDVDADESE